MILYIPSMIFKDIIRISDEIVFFSLMKDVGDLLPATVLQPFSQEVVQMRRHLLVPLSKALLRVPAAGQGSGGALLPEILPIGL